MNIQQGGIFELINVEEPTTFTSSVEANELNVRESATIEGRLNAPYITNSGVLSIHSTLETQELVNDKKGRLFVEENVIGSKVSNEGLIELKKDLKAEHIESSGEIISSGRIEGQTLSFEGSFKVKDIRAERLDFILTDDCEASSITANDIKVDAKRQALIFKDNDHLLKVDHIDGGTIYLENVIAELVRGDEVTIGPNCTIKILEYTKDYKLDNRSDVLELGKITRD
ncbi:hypothetical protein [Macrococcus hajekii]|nr:hypothetical protein [Macrococcus hajekii]